jgi:hypothetical protein
MSSANSSRPSTIIGVDGAELVLDSFRERRELEVDILVYEQSSFRRLCTCCRCSLLPLLFNTTRSSVIGEGAVTLGPLFKCMIC